MISGRRVFGDRETLAHYLAQDVAAELRRAALANGRASIAFSGGTTPALFLQSLARENLPWQKIAATLVDERQVPEDHARSNLRMLRENLAPAGLTIYPLTAERIAYLPLDAAVLGMGADGHTASFFPGGDNLKKALDPSQPPAVIGMTAAGAGEPRLTFNLSALLRSKFLALHIEGAEKLAVLDKAKGLPVNAVLDAPNPVTLYWCP
jgi:6-phosphogluconolactonase